MTRPTGSRTRLRRLTSRGRYDTEALYAVLDSGWVGHLGLVDPHAGPIVIPTTYVRLGEHVYLHGSRAARMLTLGAGPALCFTVTLLDGLVLARSGFHHSMNYRSAVIFGTGHAVTDPGQVERVLDALVERFVPGRSAQLRRPTPRELAATAIIAVPLEEASVKIRGGGPVEDPNDLATPLWVGVVPLTLTPGPPQPEDGVDPTVAPPRIAGSGPVHEQTIRKQCR